MQNESDQLVFHNHLLFLYLTELIVTVLLSLWVSFYSDLL